MNENAWTAAASRHRQAGFSLLMALIICKARLSPDSPYAEALSFSECMILGGHHS